MSFPIIRGQGNLPTQQPTKVQFSPSKGNILTKTYIGTYSTGASSDLNSLINVLVADGYEYTLMQEGKGGLWRLEATIGADEPEYTWEVSGAEEQKDILNSVNPYIQQLSLKNRQILRAAMDFYADLKGQTPSPATGTGTDEASTFYLIWQCIMAGERTIPVALPIIRRTYIASRQFQITDSAMFINSIFSKGSLISSEGVPQTYWPVMPESGPDYIGQLPVNYGYQKKSPKIELITNNRIRISQEWIFDAWSVLLGDLL